LSFAQNTGSISGNVLDLESENMPLAYAKVMVKETGAETMSDDKGVFKFENLAEGTYTLVFSFVGYETKTTETKVVNNKVTNVKQQIEASTLSLDDLALTFASTDKNDTSSN
jgi:hypothetical protein